MKIRKTISISIIVLILCVQFSCVHNSPQAVSIFNVYDEYVVNPDLEHDGRGFSCVIKTEEILILFDTIYPRDTKLILSNIEKMDMSVNDIDLVFVSHKHNDTGLDIFLKKNPNVTVYIPDSSMTYTKQLVEGYGAQYVVVSDFSRIAEGIYSTGPIESGPPCSLFEQSLIIDSSKGLVVICGCAHPGVVKILKKAKELFPSKQIHMVMGGFHLRGTPDADLEEIVHEIKNLGVKKIAPSTCSGKNFREVAKRIYGRNFIESGMGLIITL